jgi:hypothetical protein
MTHSLPDQPAGTQFNLPPIDPNLYTQTVLPLTSRDVLTNTEDYTTGTEFGGVAGMVQPPPHVPTANERRMQVMAIDPADDGTEATSVVPPDLTGDFA